VLQQLAQKTADAHADEDWSRSAYGDSRSRKFARTEVGYYVLGPNVIEEIDIVCVLFGGKMPFYLRPSEDRYMLVGECYVHGFMDGEAVETMSRGELSEQTFEIV
jgi:hypothetical protein